MLGSFLAPLLHLKRLSIDWPKLRNFDLHCNRGIFQKRFSRLTYLSLVIGTCRGVLLSIVKLCLELEELRILILLCRDFYIRSSSSEPIKLKNLRVVQFRGIQSHSLKDDLMALVPDPNEWTDFHLVDSLTEGYLERNVKLCDQLSVVKLLPQPLPYLSMDARIGWNLVSNRLLEEAIRNTHEDVPEKFCCLNDDGRGQTCLLKIEEAKNLLKDPEYQVSYLQFNHTIEHDCDAHLVASAFSNVTELVFRFIGSPSSWCQNRKMLFKRRLRKKGSMAPEEEDDTTNAESSFEMIVKSTPRLESLTIISSFLQEREWLDLDVLYLIPRWKNLRVIIFMEIPMENGNFLIDIREECQELTELQLIFPVGLPYEYGYGSGLVQMLNHCRNLRKFSIQQQLISSIEQMLLRCPELTRFVIRVLPEMDRVNTELRPDLERIVGKLNRPNLVFLGPNPDFHPKDNHEDVSNSFFPGLLDKRTSFFLKC